MSATPLHRETRIVRSLSAALAAIMVALGVVALGGAAALYHLDRDWRRALTERWTVEIDGTEAASPANMERALAALRALPGIADAEPVPPEEIHRLLRPWLKDDALAAELPLPALIDLRTVPGAPVPASVLGPKVAAAVHGAKLDDHGGWTGDLLALARTGEALGAFLFAAIGLAAAGTIAAASRARLAANGREIELMHTLGATDTYIARRFLAGPVRSTAIGAVIGAVIGFGVLAATRAVPMEAVPLLLQLRLTELDFAALTVVPIGAILLAAIVSGVAAYLSARRFP